MQVQSFAQKLLYFISVQLYQESEDFCAEQFEQISADFDFPIKKFTTKDLRRPLASVPMGLSL